MEAPGPIDSGIRSGNQAISSKYPTKLIETDICKFWFCPDNEVNAGEAKYHFHFECPVAIGSVENTTLRTLLRKRLNSLFNNFEFAGHWYDSPTGLELDLNGRSVKITVDFLLYWLRLLSHEEEEEFAKNVQAYIDGIDSYSGDLDERAMNLRSYITPNHRTSIFEAIPFLSTLRLEDFQRYCSDFFKQIHVEIFAHGNIDKKEAIDTVQRLLNGMEWKWNQIDDPSSIDVKTLHLPIGSHYLRCKVPKPRCYSSSIQNFYSIGRDSIQSRAMLDLFMSFVKSPIHDNDNSDININCIDRYAAVQGLIGYDMYAYFSESKHSADYVDRFIEQIRHDLINLVDRMTDEKFVEKRSSSVTVSDINYWTMRSYWHQIKFHTYQFNVYEEKERYLGQISKAEFLTFLREHCDQGKHRKLSVQIIRDPSSKCGIENGCIRACDTTHHKLIPKPISFVKSTSERFLGDLLDFKNDLANRLD